MTDTKVEGWGVLNLETKKYEQAKWTKKAALKVVDDLNAVNKALKVETRYAVIPGNFDKDFIT